MANSISFNYKVHSDQFSKRKIDVISLTLFLRSYFYHRFS